MSEEAKVTPNDDFIRKCDSDGDKAKEGPKEGPVSFHDIVESSKLLCRSRIWWCRGTESSCRHQPFQGARENNNFNELSEFRNAISDI